VANFPSFPPTRHPYGQSTVAPIDPNILVLLELVKSLKTVFDKVVDDNAVLRKENAVLRKEIELLKKDVARQSEKLNILETVVNEIKNLIIRIANLVLSFQKQFNEHVHPYRICLYSQDLLGLVQTPHLFHTRPPD
jgi:regulator of replication initiation timing